MMEAVGTGAALRPGRMAGDVGASAHARAYHDLARLTEMLLLWNLDETDNEMLMPLQDAEAIVGARDGVRRVEVSARTKPEDAFARVDPDSLSPQQRESELRLAVCSLHMDRRITRFGFRGNVQPYECVLPVWLNLRFLNRHSRITDLEGRIGGGDAPTAVA